MKGIYRKLMEIQRCLKAPKGQYNAFGKYSYRSCEDILDAVKPLLSEQGAALILSDKIECISGRYYVQALARFIDIENGEEITSAAYAREEEQKKGMDGSQITGASSSYARKYALNGLFCIDDNKDSDSTHTGPETAPKTQRKQNQPEYEGNKTKKTDEKSQKAEQNDLYARGGAKVAFEPLICQDCSNTILATEKFSAREIAAGTKAAYGRQLCNDCGKKARDAKKAQLEKKEETHE